MQFTFTALGGPGFRTTFCWKEGEEGEGLWSSIGTVDNLIELDLVKIGTE